MVPYLHVTTRIEGHPYDSLLSEKGGTGFPTLMFLDAKGRKLMKHGGPRTADGFDESLVQVQEFQTLEKKAEAGDAKAATELLIRKLRLEWFDFAEAKTQIEALAKVSSKQEKMITQLLVDTEVRSLTSAAGKDDAKRLEAGARFLEMWEGKALPASDAQLFSFWTILADYAEDKRDKKLFKKVVGEFEDALKNSRYGRALKGLESRLKDFPKK